MAIRVKPGLEHDYQVQHLIIHEICHDVADSLEGQRKHDSEFRFQLIMALKRVKELEPIDGIDLKELGNAMEWEYHSSRHDYFTGKVTPETIDYREMLVNQIIKGLWGLFESVESHVAGIRFVFARLSKHFDSCVQTVL
ncbi:MAG: hypothetical protein P9M14_11225 [Candidatus Alcyoniella australis]|nr:hypothetical protein [Candidatus Alcyoniella australis]